jgi:hypothetical protein
MLARLRLGAHQSGWMLATYMGTVQLESPRPSALMIQSVYCRCAVSKGEHLYLDPVLEAVVCLSM